VSLSIQQRTAILNVARSWIDVPYDDSNADAGWNDIASRPASFDCATFVCRVAMDALGVSRDRLIADARWLIDRLPAVAAPMPGDLVCYERPGARNDRVVHVMLYEGNGRVIGACDIQRRVVARAFDYKAVATSRRWRLLDGAPYREFTFSVVEPGPK
jgi:hypothetical protein